MVILDLDPDKINLNDSYNFYQDDLDSIIHIRLLAWHDKLETQSSLKKINEELMPVA